MTATTLSIALALPWSLAEAAEAPDVTAEEARRIAVEAYVYLYPLVTMDLTRRVMTTSDGPGSGPPNAFHHLREYPSVDLTTVVRPNFDTLYSMAWLDLTDGPVVISVPDTGGRYYLLPMLDLWTDVFAAPGARTSGTGEGSFAVAPPGFRGELPKGVERIDAPTPNVWVIGRTQTNGPADYDAVHAIQDGFRIEPLPRSARRARGPAAAEPDAPPLVAGVPPKEQVRSMTGEDFFRYAADLLRVNPPHLTDWSQLARLRRIGLVVGERFDPAAASPSVREAIVAAPAAGLEAMAERAPSIGRVVDGWVVDTDTIGVYGDTYLKRAIIADIGLGANQPEDAVYPLALTDASGDPLVGGKDYVLRFEASELPPVDAFWSVTMYDANGFAIPNPIDRYALGDRDELSFGPDGSLELYIQPEDLGADRASNWLPSPASGTLGLTMRLYAPRPEVLDGSWTPPAVEPAGGAE